MKATDGTDVTDGATDYTDGHGLSHGWARMEPRMTRMGTDRAMDGHGWSHGCTEGGGYSSMPAKVLP